MKNDKFAETFDFSKKVRKNIKKAYKNFIKESKKIGKDINISREKKDLVVFAFINTMTEKILDKKEKEQNIKFSEEERNYFKEKILEIIK